MSMSEFSREKAFWLFYFFLIILALSYGYIGAHEAQKSSIVFYVALLGIPGMIMVFFDWATKGSELEEIDTMTIEEPHSGMDWLSPKLQIILGIIAAVFIFYKIAVTGSAFVDAPKWSIFETPLGNAVYSGLIGVIENLNFFGILFPTLIAIFHKYSDSIALALILAMVLTAIGFVSYHNWRYGYSETALASVAVFAFINVIVVYGTQSLIISDAMHFGNNMAVSLGLAKRIALTVIF